MTVIGLTGNIASGKSMVAKVLEELGARVISADEVAREVVEPRTPAWNRIREVFGDEVLNRDLTINRKKLGEMVFGNTSRINELNSITHPVIIEKIAGEIAGFRAGADGRSKVLIVEAPLLLETGLDKLVDEVWVVGIPEEVQINRLIKRDHLTRGQALDRIHSQMPAEEKRKLAGVFIDNSGDIDSTRTFIHNLWNDRFTEPGVERVEK